eukprot:SAG31_NODE_2217_length_6168_cov_10.730598_1_plen_177_part_00
MAAGAEARGGALRFRGLRPTLAAVLCAQSLGLEGAAAGTKYNWQLVYKTTSLVDSGTEQGLGKDAVDDAWHSCDEHVSGIRYDINEKPYAYYRRNHESKDDKKFSAWELISECWKSKQDTDAPNMLTTDFGAGHAKHLLLLRYAAQKGLETFEQLRWRNQWCLALMHCVARRPVLQ